LHHCWTELEFDEKWKNLDMHELGPRRKNSIGDTTIIDGDGNSRDHGERSTTPHSVARTKRPDGRKQASEKGKRTGDDDIKFSFNALMNASKEMSEERMEMTLKETKELKVADDCKVAATERRAAAEERRAAMGNEQRATENEQNLMFKDTTHMDEKQNAYTELCREQVLRSKQQAMGGMGSGYMVGDMGGGYMGGGFMADGMGGGYTGGDSMGCGSIANRYMRGGYMGVMGGMAGMRGGYMRAMASAMQIGMEAPLQTTMVGDIAGGNGGTSTSYDIPVTPVDAHVHIE
jgi:hypothetical protein